jgi:hypothetical protein
MPCCPGESAQVRTTVLSPLFAAAPLVQPARTRTRPPRIASTPIDRKAGRLARRCTVPLSTPREKMHLAWATAAGRAHEVHHNLCSEHLLRWARAAIHHRCTSLVIVSAAPYRVSWIDRVDVPTNMSLNLRRLAARSSRASTPLSIRPQREPCRMLLDHPPRTECAHLPPMESRFLDYRHCEQTSKMLRDSAEKQDAT